MAGRGYAFVVWMTLSGALFLAAENVGSWLDNAAASGGQVVSHVVRLLLGGP